MKIMFIFLAAAGISLKSSSMVLPADSSKMHLSHIDYGLPAARVLPYHYDSLRLTSPFHFEHPVSVTKQAYARIVYPVFEDDKLNSVVKGAVLSPLKVKYQFQNSLNAEHPAMSNMDAVNNGAAEFRELAANFLGQFETEAPDVYLKAYWYADIQVKVIRKTRDFTAVECEKDHFTGGFHDLYDYQFLNYDNRSRQPLTLESQLKPNKLDQLKSIAERIIRKNEGLTPSAELDGYFFENDKFDLPANFTITDQGLMFSYGYNEIKPFAAGTTKLTIPFADLKSLVLPGSVLALQMSGH
jgi:hypothetical protein